MMKYIEKQEQIYKVCDRNRLPNILSNGSYFQSERKNYDCKESDFIKRIKRAKSIMIAHKHRKQKNVLNAYFMQSAKKKKSPDNFKSNESILSDIRRKQKIGFQHKNQINLLPPVHSSVQINMNIRKKRNAEIVQPNCSYDKVSQNFCVLSTRFKRQPSVIKAMQRHKQIEINTSVRSCPRWEQNQRECINYTSMKISKTVEQNNYEQSQDRVSQVIGIGKKHSNHFRSLTEQKGQQNKVYRIERWSFAQDLYQCHQK